jgi:hypothetical protein
MFHVSPLMPIIEEDPARKRHLGNDLVVILFKDSKNEVKIDLASFRSQFNRTSLLPPPSSSLVPPSPLSPSPYGVAV